jgi:hypothetical protein
MERHERKTITTALETLPAGFVIIRSGKTRPDDMVFCWTSAEWFRADSPEWLQQTPVDVRNCVAVARRPGLDGFENAARRSYRLGPAERVRLNRTPTPAPTPKKALQDPQGLLF